MKSFSHVESAYQVAQAAGVGECKVVLPAGLKSMLGNMEDCVFLDETPSGSLSARGYDELATMAGDMDGVLLAGEHGNNEETTSLIERLASNINVPVVATQNTMQQLAYDPSILANRPRTLLVIDYSNLSDWLDRLKLPIAFTSQLNWRDLTERINSLQAEHSKACWAITKDSKLYVACDGRLSATDIDSADQTALSALTAVFWLQNMGQPFEAITTAAYIASQAPAADDGGAIAGIKKVVSEYE